MYDFAWLIVDDSSADWPCRFRKNITVTKFLQKPFLGIIKAVKRAAKRQMLLKTKVVLAVGVLLIVLSPLIAYGAAPIGCILFPPAIDPNAWYVFPPCLIVDFYSFCVLLLSVLVAGTILTIYAMRSLSSDKRTNGMR